MILMELIELTSATSSLAMSVGTSAIIYYLLCVQSHCFFFGFSPLLLLLNQTQETVITVGLPVHDSGRK